MIKTAIIYATHHGTTEKIAKLIQQQLHSQSIDLINLKVNKHLCIGDYETIILGSSIHAGKNQAIMQDFCKKNMPELLQKRIGLFLCCMNKTESENNICNAYPEILRNRAFSIQLLGGEYKMEKMNFIEKFLLKKIVSVTASQSNINYDSISEFGKEINDESLNAAAIILLNSKSQ